MKILNIVNETSIYDNMLKEVIGVDLFTILQSPLKKSPPSKEGTD